MSVGHRTTMQNKMVVLPEDSALRKKYAIYSGVISPFPNALALIARLSYEGNLKHCEDGAEMNWAEDKSPDHADCLLRHQAEEELVAVGWRALAQLEVAVKNGYNPFGVELEDQHVLDPYFGRNIDPPE